jgi:hypothetical protein
VLPAYILKLKDMGYTYRISLINKESDLSALMSESPFLASPVIYPTEQMIYKGGKKIEIESPVEGAEIRYTLDGSEPNEKSMMYNGAFQIASDCVVKAKTYKKGENPSVSVSHAFSFGEILYESPVIKFGDQPVACDVQIEGFKSIGILITDPDKSADWDHTDVLEPVLVKKDGSEKSLTEIKPYVTFQDWGSLAVNRSVDRKPLTVAGITYSKGLGTHGLAEIWYRIDNDVTRLKLKVGVDDETERRGSSTITYKIVGTR